MPTIRFNHVFAALLAFSFVSAFLLRDTRPGVDRLRGHVQGLFSWVAKPVHRVAGLAHDGLAAAPVVDKRSAEAVRRENDLLKIDLVNAQDQLRALRQLNAERDLVGSVRAMCVAVPVTGADTGHRESLSLQATGEQVQPGMPVLYPGGLAGRVSRAGASGAQVQLLTDPQNTVQVGFGRFLRDGDRVQFARLALAPRVATGVGDQTLQVTTIPMKEVTEAGLAIGDWVILSDEAWPMSLQGYRVGRVASVEPYRALFADVRIRPAANLLGLREVMVMTKR